MNIVILFFQDIKKQFAENCFENFFERSFIVYCLLFIVLFAKNCTNQIKSNYLNSHGEEAQERPPGL